MKTKYKVEFSRWTGSTSCLGRFVRHCITMFGKTILTLLLPNTLTLHIKNGPVLVIKTNWCSFLSYGMFDIIFRFSVYGRRSTAYAHHSL